MPSEVSAPVPLPPRAPAPSAAVPAPDPRGPAVVVPGVALPVAPGQELAARVVAVADGRIALALAGGLITAASDLPVEPGQRLRLVVRDAGPRRITLELAAGQEPAGGRGGPAAALARAGLPPAAASALLSALAGEGLEVPPTVAAALAGRAAAAGVSTPAAAAAFARLEAAGLPTTRAAVGGLAHLLDGAPLGRALAAIADALAARAGGPADGGTPDAASSGRAIAQPTTPAAQVPETPDPRGLPGAASDRTSSARAADASPALAGGTGTIAARQAREAGLAALATALAETAAGIGAGATDGRGEALRRALEDLGVGTEHRLHARGEASGPTPLRSLLLQLAGHPDADAALARAAGAIADAVGAQALAGASLPGPAGATAPGDPAAQAGAYLQLPLPGGGTAEVRVTPDGGGGDGEGGRRPRRLAFLLHLSALGPVLIEATAGPGGVEATVRACAEPARAFPRDRAGELAEALRAGGPARVAVERMGGPVPERLLAPPPPSGLDLSA